MKKVILAIVVLAAASACTVRTERTVVERPAAVPATAVVTTTDPAVVTPAPTAVVVPVR